MMNNFSCSRKIHKHEVGLNKDHLQLLRRPEVLTCWECVRAIWKRGCFFQNYFWEDASTLFHRTLEGRWLLPGKSGSAYVGEAVTPTGKFLVFPTVPHPRARACTYLLHHGHMYI